MVTIEVTNSELFRNVEVDTTGLQSRGADSRNRSLGFKGSISIDSGAGWNSSTGEFGSSDYENEFGFKIVAE
jgi:hypothetical protein